MDILKSFEVFFTEPLSVLKDRIVQIVGISTGDDLNPKITTDLLNHKTQITVMNNDKMYNILKRVNAKYKTPESAVVKFLTKKDDMPKTVFGSLTLRL